MNKIDSKDISVVVQGAVGKDTRACLKSIRRCLPNAEVILSTWKGTDVKGLDYDELVLNEDPGALFWPFRIEKIPDNVNRQLVSTQAGLAVARRKYALKFRTDLIMKNTNFLNYFDAFPAREKDYSFFKHRVITSSLYSREFYLGNFVLFHPSDMWMFGLRADICDYFMKTPLISLPKERKFVYAETWRFAGVRYVPEQCFCVNWIARHKRGVDFSYLDEITLDNINVSQRTLYNNFIFLGGFQSGIISKKHIVSYRNEYSSKDVIYGLITYEKFQQRYKEFCDSGYTVVPDYWRIVYKLRENIWALFFPIKKVVRYFIKLFRAVYYSFYVIWLKLLKRGGV